MRDLGQGLDNSDHVIRRADGTQVPVLKSARSVTIKGHEKLLETFVDISAHKQLEAALEARTRELEGAKTSLERNAAYLSQVIERLKQAQDDADRANRAKSDFLAKMSHEIRTPMNAIIGMTDLVLSTELSQQQREYLLIVLQSGENLLDVINDILDFSKIEAGKIKIENVEFSLIEVLRAVENLFGMRVKEKGLILETHIDPCVPERVMSDPTRLRQILVNLIGNSVKFTEEGRITLRVELEGNEQTLLHLSVSDTGIGIPPDAQSRIFDSFAQADDTTSRRYGGTGLGTTISRQLIELMEGTISVHSPANTSKVGGPGTTFDIVLPVTISQRKPFVSQKQAVDESQAGQSSVEDVGIQPNREPSSHFDGIGLGKKLLLVEDNKFNAILAVALFRKLGFEVVTATNGQLAVEAYKSDTFDLVFMDVFMPVKDGFLATEEIRDFERSAGRHTPIIAMTALASDADRQRCLDAGMDDYVSKPIRKDELTDCIIKYVASDSVIQ